MGTCACATLPKENTPDHANDSDVQLLNINDSEFRIKHKLDNSLHKRNKFESNIDNSHLNNIIITVADKHFVDGIYEIQPGKCNNKYFYKNSNHDQYLYYVQYTNSENGRWQIGPSQFIPPNAEHYVQYDTSSNEYKLQKINNNDPIAFVNSSAPQPFSIKNDKQWLIKKKTDFVEITVKITQQETNKVPKSKIYTGKLLVVSKSTFHILPHILHEFESIELEEDSILTTRPWNDQFEKGGKIFLKSRTNVILHENAKISASALGYIYYDNENKNDMTMLKLGKGGHSYYDQHVKNTSTKYGRGGGTVYIFCERLVIGKKAIIEANGDKYPPYGEGGFIHINARYLSLGYGSKIEALQGDNWSSQSGFQIGTIEMDISSFTFIDGFVAMESPDLKMPVEVTGLIIRFWNFDSEVHWTSINPTPNIIFK
eukprot:489848_1